MLSHADLTVVTKIVLVSQTEEVFQANIGVLGPLETDVFYWGE